MMLSTNTRAVILIIYVDLEIIKNSRKPQNESQSSSFRNALFNNRNDLTISKSNELKDNDNKTTGRQEFKYSKSLNINIQENDSMLTNNYPSRNNYLLKEGQNEENRQTYSSLIMKEEKDK